MDGSFTFFLKQEKSLCVNLNTEEMSRCIGGGGWKDEKARARQCIWQSNTGQQSSRGPAPARADRSLMTNAKQGASAE